jgi:hypothetical protein
MLAFLIGCAMFGAIVFLPLFLQVVTGASATNSGLLLLPLMAGLIATSIGSGRVITRTGRYRAWPIAGMGLSALGMGLLSTMDIDTGRLESSLYMLILGLGIGMVMQVVVLAVQNSAPSSPPGSPPSCPACCLGDRGGGGVPSSTSCSTARMPSGRCHPRSGGAVIEALSSGILTVFLVAVTVLLVGFALAWLLREIPLRDTFHVGGGAIEGAGESIATALETGADPDNPPELVLRR